MLNRVKKSMPVRWLEKAFVRVIEVDQCDKSKTALQTCASGSDENVRITPKINFSLEEAMEYIEKDEYHGGDSETSACEKYCWMKMSEKELQKIN